MTLSKSIDQLGLRLDQFTNKYEKLKLENETLKQDVSKLKSDLKSKSEDLDALKEKLRVVSLAKSLDEKETQVETKKDLKLKINEMMRELDKCIAVLNS